jgi:hypothetical protein
MGEQISGLRTGWHKGARAGKGFSRRAQSDTSSGGKSNERPDQNLAIVENGSARKNE